LGSDIFEQDFQIKILTLSISKVGLENSIILTRDECARGQQGDRIGRIFAQWLIACFGQ
jgi:hypothetical protein